MNHIDIKNSLGTTIQGNATPKFKQPVDGFPGFAVQSVMGAFNHINNEQTS